MIIFVVVTGEYEEKGIALATHQLESAINVALKDDGEIEVWKDGEFLFCHGHYMSDIINKKGCTFEEVKREINEGIIHKLSEVPKW